MSGTTAQRFACTARDRDSQAVTVRCPASSLSPWRPSMVARNAVNVKMSRLGLAARPMDQLVRFQSPAQFLQSAHGMIGEIAVKNAKIAPRGTVSSTSSGRGSGSRSSLPSMVVKSAKTIHLHTNLMRRLATSHVAQSLALVVGVSGAHAMHRFRILEASFVVGDHKLEFTPSRRRLNMVVKNAARSMATQKIRPVAMFVVKNIASASGLHGALAASHVSMPRHFQELVEPSREPTKLLHPPSAVAGTALILIPMVPLFLMARKRSRKGATKMLVAPVNASDHGASGVTAIKHALTVRAMVPLARSCASSLSLKQPCMVENRA